MSKVLSEGNGGDFSERVFWEHYNVKKELDKKQMALNSAKGEAKKRAKEDGIDWKDFQAIEKTASLSFNEQLAAFNRQNRMMSFLHMRIAEFIPMIDETLSDETGMSDEQREKKWDGHGYVKGRSGESLADALQGHDPTSETGQWISVGWERGQQALGTRNRSGPARTPPAPPVAKEPAKPAEEKTEEKTEEKVKPKPEPEVAAAGAKKAAAKKSGVSYWHHEERRQVFEIGVSDAPAPDGSVNITKKEYEALKAKYDKEWDESSPPAPSVDDGFDSPPDPGTKLN